MPGDEDRSETLQQLLKIHQMVSDTDLGISFDTGVLEELIEQSLKFQERQEEVKTELPKTGRRAAIEAQKARKAANVG
jgi:hypothetical protein